MFREALLLVARAKDMVQVAQGEGDENVAHDQLVRFLLHDFAVERECGVDEPEAIGFTFAVGVVTYLSSIGTADECGWEKEEERLGACALWKQSPAADQMAPPARRPTLAKSTAPLAAATMRPSEAKTATSHMANRRILMDSRAAFHSAFSSPRHTA